MRPTNLIKVPIHQVPQKVLDRLLEKPVIRGQTIPGKVIPITKDKAGTVIVRVITLP